MQNSALNFSILVDEKKIDLEQLKLKLENTYHLKYNKGLELVTIRHYNTAILDEMKASKTCLVEQKTRTTARIVLKNLA